MNSLRKFCCGVSFAIALFFTAGCVSQNPAGRLLASTVQSVDAAMQGWSTYVALGNATVDQETAVRSSYAKYQATVAAAEVAYVAAAKLGDESAWQRAANALRASQRDLLTLIATFQPK